MPRLASFQMGDEVRITPTSGPGARNSGATTAQDGFEQTFDTVGDLVALRLELVPRRGISARRERGLFTRLMEGGNATRLTFNDPDLMSPQEAGIDVPAHDWERMPSPTWSNGQPWSNGLGWGVTPPTVPVAAVAAVNTDTVTLADEAWGHRLGEGDYLGFFPFSFGLYMVTEVIDPGQYRVWPRLRTALTTEHFATLLPTIVMRPRGRDAVSMSRGTWMTDGSSIELVEVIDPYVRRFFSE